MVHLLYQKYNVLIDENEYNIRYDIPHAYMFVIGGMEKVRDVIEKNGNFMVKSRNLKEKPKERRLRKRALLKMQIRGYVLKYIQKRKIRIS